MSGTPKKHKALAPFAIGAALGLLAGLAVAVSMRPTPPVASSTVVRTSAPRETRSLAHGFFERNGAVRQRTAKGNVSVYPGQVRLEADFEVVPGSQYHLYLVAVSEITAKTRMTKGKFVDLGPLRAAKGEQGYTVPEAVRLAQYPTVAIWSKRTNSLVAAASLEFR